MRSGIASNNADLESVAGVFVWTAKALFGQPDISVMAEEFLSKCLLRIELLTFGSSVLHSAQFKSLRGLKRP